MVPGERLRVLRSSLVARPKPRAASGDVVMWLRGAAAIAREKSRGALSSGDKPGANQAGGNIGVIATPRATRGRKWVHLNHAVGGARHSEGAVVAWARCVGSN